MHNLTINPSEIKLQQFYNLLILNHEVKKMIFGNYYQIGQRKI